LKNGEDICSGSQLTLLAFSSAVGVGVANARVGRRSPERIKEKRITTDLIGFLAMLYQASMV
jgi:hypothetical protein